MLVRVALAMGSEEAQKNSGPAAGGLLHDSALAHRSVLVKDSVLVQDFLAKNNVTSLEHPHTLLTKHCDIIGTSPYSPDQTM